MSAPTRATLYVRASIPSRVREHVYDVVDDLESLADREVLEDVAVETWDARVPVEGGADRINREAYDAYAAFREWAEARGRSLEPYFRVRESDRGEVLVLPIMCLAVESDEGVEAVYPSETDEEKATVLDGIAALEEKRPIAAN